MRASVALAAEVEFFLGVPAGYMARTLCAAQRYMYLCSVADVVQVRASNGHVVVECVGVVQFRALSHVLATCGYVARVFVVFCAVHRKCSGLSVFCCKAITGSDWWQVCI